MKKRSLSLFLAVIMVFSLLPVDAFAAEVEIPVSGNVIDITDSVVMNVSANQAIVTGIKITGADVVSATEDGTTINVVLSADTEETAVVTTEPVFSMPTIFRNESTTSSCRLKDGEGSAKVTASVRFMPQPQLGALKEYTVKFTTEMSAGTNYAPALKGGNSANASVTRGETYTLDLTTVFKDRNNDELTYTVKVNEEEALSANANYTFTTETVGEYTLVFTANDGELDSPEYTVNLTVNKKNFSVTLPVSECYVVNGEATVVEESKYTFTVEIAEGINAENMVVMANGTVVTAEDGVYTVENVNANLVITITGIANVAPELKGENSVNAEITRGEIYSLNLTTIFKDKNEDELTYTVKVNEGEAVSANANYTFTPETAGEYTLVFTANDGEASSPEYTVKLTVNKKVFNVTITTGDGYVISGETSVAEGENYKFTIAIDENFNADNMVVMANGTVVTAEEGVYTVENVNANLTITVDGLIDTRLPLVDPTNILTGGLKPDKSWGYVDTITVNNVAVEEYKWQGDTAYVVLTEDTADDAEVKVSFKTGGMRMGNMPDTAIKLENGEAEKSFTAKTTVFNYTWNFKLVFSNKGFEPTLADGADEGDDVTAYVDNEFVFDVSDKFTSILGKELSYYVKEDDGEYVKLEGSEYKFTPSEIGTKTLVFKANDGKLDSDKTYTLNMTIENVTYSEMCVNVPEDVELTFYGGNEQEEQLNAVRNENKYTVTIPSKYAEINFLDADNRGMIIPAEEDGEITVVEVETKLVNIADATVEGTAKVTYGEYTAKSNGNSHLLAVDTEYTYTAQPKDSSYSSATKTEVLENNTSVTIQVGISNQATITVSDGAVPYLYKYNNYYSYTEISHIAMVDNDDDTTTYYYSASIGRNPYRVVKEGYITKAGWWDYGTSLKVLHTEDDLTPDTRVDYTETGLTVGDDGVFVNVNGQNHLNLAVGGTKTLKAYRIWEIIMFSYENRIITPDFHFNILSGDDVISLTERKSPSTNDGDWMTVTALKEGTAVIEVSYDALQVSGGHYPGVYGATDPARTALIVVTVGGTTPSVNFGIDGKASQGSVIYENSTSKAWDAEFDTLYFTGDKGEIKLEPTVKNDTITEVAVSNDKGASWTVLNAENGTYTAPIASGNNIIRVTTENGVAYQIVRGDKVTVRLVNETHPNEPFAKGDTVRVYIDGLHQPIPKMAGNYNPGYGGNTDGYSQTHMSFIWNGERVQGKGSQYAFAYSSNYIDVTIPENTDATSFTLSEGCLATGVIGLTTFADGGDSHRNIPDSGCATRGDKTTFNTRSVLPEITIEIGGMASANTAPFVKSGVQTEATITLGKTFAINLESVFEDAEGNELTYKLGEETLENPYFTITPEETGEYQLVFTASDGEFETSHTITLTVEQASIPSLPPAGDDFGISADEIEGYVYVSFEDNGKRVEGEKGVSYPNPLGTIIARTKVPYVAEDTIADVTLRLLEAKNMTASYSGSTKGNFYLSSIGNFTVGGIDYDSFGEFDAGVGSGWMITHNDIFIDQGASQFEVADGDEIKWKYTCQYGADIGDPYFDSMGGTITPVKNAVDNVEELIDAIGDVTLDSKAAIEEARAAYEALTDSQKNLVENYNDLLNAESRYEALLKTEKLPFTDVEKHWGIEAIMYVFDNNIMNGTSDTTFEPDTLLSRGMLITTLYRLAGSPEVTAKNPFPDVKADEWYTDAVIWAYENGIVNGYDDGNFGPNDNITREQMDVMLMNYAHFKGIDTSAKNDLSQFADAENASAWAVEAVKWAVAEGLITGRDTGLMPKAEANRAETATVLMRFMEK